MHQPQRIEPAAEDSDVPLVSIVCPMMNEVENVRPLLEEIEATCTGLWPFEMIVVDDGSDDGTGEVVDEMRRTRPWLRRVRHDRSSGKSAAVWSGVGFAKGAYVCTIDGDGQNPPDQLGPLLAPLLDEHAAPDLGLVAGQRVGRKDTLSKRAASRFANRLRGAILKDGTRDTACGLKAFRRDAFLQMPYFNEMHRFLPAIFIRGGWGVTHVDVVDRPRWAGISKYSNFRRAMVGVYDLFGVSWLIRRKLVLNAAEVRLVDAPPPADEG